MKKNKLLTLLALVLSLGLMVACGGSKSTDTSSDTTSEVSEEVAGETDQAETSQDEEPAEESIEDVEKLSDDSTFVVGATDLNGSYINGFGNSTYDLWIKRLLGNYDGVLSYDTYYYDEANQFHLNPTAVDGEPEITENEDGSKTYTFKIHEDLVWNDETPITAKDYVFEILYISSPEWMASTADNSASHEALLGFEDYNSGQSEEFAGVELIDDYTFSVTLSPDRVPYYFEEAFVTIGPVPMHRYAPNLDVDVNKLVVAEGYEISEEDNQALIDNQQLAVDEAQEEYDAAVEVALGTDEIDVTKEDIEAAIEEAAATEPAEDEGLEEEEEAEEAAEDEENEEDLLKIHIQPAVDAGLKLREEEETLAGYEDGSIDLDAKSLLMESSVNDIVYNYRYEPDVTYGPYNFVVFENNMVKVELNPLYKGNAEGKKPTIPNVIVQTVNQKLDVDLAINGTIDFVSGAVDGEKIDKARASDAVNFTDYPRNGYGVLEIICNQGPTQHKGVRQAIAYSLDRNEFVQNIQGGYGTVVNGCYGLAEFEYQERGAEFEGQANFYALNSEAANAALDTTPYLYEADGTTPWDPAKAQEEYSNGKENFNYWRHDEEGNRLRVIHDASTENDVSDLIIVQLPDNSKLVGMEYVVSQVPFNTLLDHYYNPDPEDPDAPTVFNMGIGFSTPHDNYFQYHSSQIGVGNNLNRLVDPEVDKILEDARYIEPDNHEAWLDGWVDFNLWYNDNLPNIPLYANQYHDIYGTRVENVTTTPFHDWSLRICDISLAN